LGIYRVLDYDETVIYDGNDPLLARREFRDVGIRNYQHFSVVPNGTVLVGHTEDCPFDLVATTEQYLVLGHLQGMSMEDFEIGGPLGATRH
jgi:hypothetical protein